MELTLPISEVRFYIYLQIYMAKLAKYETYNQLKEREFNRISKFRPLPELRADSIPAELVPEPVRIEVEAEQADYATKVPRSTFEQVFANLVNGVSAFEPQIEEEEVQEFFQKVPTVDPSAVGSRVESVEESLQESLTRLASFNNGRVSDEEEYDDFSEEDSDVVEEAPDEFEEAPDEFDEDDNIAEDEADNFEEDPDNLDEGDNVAEEEADSFDEDENGFEDEADTFDEDEADNFDEDDSVSEDESDNFEEDADTFEEDPDNFDEDSDDFDGGVNLFGGGPNLFEPSKIDDSILDLTVEQVVSAYFKVGYLPKRPPVKPAVGVAKVQKPERVVANRIKEEVKPKATPPVYTNPPLPEDGGRFQHEDLIAFARRKVRVNESEALRYFSPKEIEQALKQGKLLKKRGVLIFAHS